MQRTGQYHLRSMQRWGNSGQFAAVDFANNIEAKGSLVCDKVDEGIRLVSFDCSLLGALHFGACIVI